VLAPGASASTLLTKTASRDAVRRALVWVAAERQSLIAETVAIAQIPAPTFNERQRAEHVAARLKQIGAAEVATFGSGNVIGRFGPAEGVGIALLAHLDTVFDAALDHTVRSANGRLYAPGIGDNAIGIAGTLQACAALQAADVALMRPVWIVADVGEEGLGDLRGARESVDLLNGRLGAMLAIEGTMLGRLGHVAVGSRRLRVRFSGSGGHSWLDFGRASAVHAAVQAAAEISTLPVPAEPRTTYNIGRIEGGQGVNVLAASAEMLLDLRSVEPAALADLFKRVEAVLHGQSATCGGAITVDIAEVGNRPAGSIARTHPLVELCALTLQRLGVRPEPTAGSTDANISLSRGIPSLAIGITRGGGTHSPAEWVEVEPASLGVQQLVLLIAALAGSSR
jgi:tripeptide aminopeptidase